MSQMIKGGDNCTTKDLIDRNAAIEAIMSEPPEAHYPDWYVSIIKKLPSVIQAEKGKP